MTDVWTELAKDPEFMAAPQQIKGMMLHMAKKAAVERESLPTKDEVEALGKRVGALEGQIGALKEEMVRSLRAAHAAYAAVTKAG